MSSIARLDPALARAIIEGFPNAPNWQSLDCTKLVQSKRATAIGKRDWTALQHCEKKGGVYAFLFPGHLFSTPRRIALHAPQKNKGKQIIEFEFSSHPALVLPNGHMVAYVGRTANLLDRIQGHFSLSGKSTLAQVQYGLVNSRTCSTRSDAVRFMLENATLVYSVLEGPSNVANRDVIEVALWAKYMTPFNIKSER
jgi:hypothetical protein